MSRNMSRALREKLSETLATSWREKVDQLLVQMIEQTERMPLVSTLRDPPRRRYPRHAARGMILNPFTLFGREGRLFYGAAPDRGETNDPTVDATAYDAGMIYRYGDIVLDSGTYYFYFGKLPASGVSLATTTSWMACSNFLYVDATSGNNANTYNSNPATAKAAPIQTLARLYVLSGAGGPLPNNSLILMKRGESWIGNIQLGTHGGSTTRYIVGAYGTRSSARPRIQYDDIFGLSRSACVWAPDSVVGAGCINLWLDGRMYSRIDITNCTNFLAGDTITHSGTGATGVIQRASAASGAGFLMVITNWNLSTAAAGNPIFAFNGTVTSTSGGTATCTNNPGPGHVSGSAITGPRGGQVNLTVENTTHAGCGFGKDGNTAGPAGRNISGDHALIYNCRLTEVSRRSTAGAGIGGAHGEGCIVRFNSVIGAGEGSALTHGMYVYDLGRGGAGAEICYFEFNYIEEGSNMAWVTHGVENNVYVRWNDIYKCGNGLGPAIGYATAEEMNNFVIAFNRIREVGHGQYFTDQGYGTLADSCPGLIYASNLIYKPKSGGLQVTHKNGAGDAIASNVKVWNNTVYSDDEIAYCFHLSGPLTGLELRNNIGWNGGATNPCLTKTSTLSNSEVTLSNNRWHRPNAGNSNHWSWDTVSRDLTYMQGTLSKESGSSVGDPLFVNVATAKGGMRLKSSSPCKNAGTPVSITIDFLGNARHASTPSIGCYE